MRIIAHLDMDAFFAAVEERDRPYLGGAPIAVGADPAGGAGRGVVATANYAARAYGIRSAMPIREAWRRSEATRAQGRPPVVFLAPRFRAYGEASQKAMAIVALHLEPAALSLFERAPPALEQVSVDECYFDLSFSGSFAKARGVAERIKKRLRREIKLSCSIGIGPNKLIAKVASDFEKPNGLTVVPPEDASRFLEPLSVSKIPGVGPKAEARFAHLGVRTVRDAKKLAETELRDLFGKWGSGLFRKFRGESNEPVAASAAPAKSIGEQETLPEDSLDMNVLLPFLARQAGDVARRLKRGGFRGFRTVALTVRFADFTTVSRSRTFHEPLVGQDIEKLERHAMQLFFPFLDRRENPHRKKIRLLGVRVEKLE